MRDLKRTKARKTRANKAKKESRPIPWKKLFHRLVILAVLTTSGILILLGGVLGSQLLLASDMFHVAGIRVVGNQRLPAHEVVAQSDIQTGSSIFDLDLAKIGNELQKNPWIQQAGVERIFPRQVVIRLVEREPVAIVNLGYLYYMDASGEVFKVLSGEDVLDYPVITGVDRQLYLQDRPQAQRRLGLAAALVQQLARRQGFNLAQVSELQVDADGNIQLFTAVGAVPIQLGRDRFMAKLDRMEKIYGQLKPRLRALASIDLRVDDRVIVKVSETEPNRV